MDFLASRIAEEAACEGAPFSEVERKMLYFTEAEYLLPDMEEVEARFDAEYDQSEYEEKVSRLMASLYRRLRKESRHDLKSWNEAIKFLERQNHYVLVMVERAKASREATWRKRPIVVKFAAVAVEIFIFGIGEMKYHPFEWIADVIARWYRSLSPNMQAVLRDGSALLAVLLLYLAISRYGKELRQMRERRRLRARAFRRVMVNLQGRLVEFSPEGTRLADEELRD